jgi:hypothetical protein
MYPAGQLLSYARLRAWVDACPDLALCFRESDSAAHTAQGQEGQEAAVAGVVIVLPLKRAYWEDLLCGRLKEGVIEAGVMFPCVGGGGGGGGEVGNEGEGEVQGGECGWGIEEVGLHVYHIERFDAGSSGYTEGQGKKGKRFAEYALTEAVRRAQARVEWKVIGMSGTWRRGATMGCTSMGDDANARRCSTHSNTGR